MPRFKVVITESVDYTYEVEEDNEEYAIDTAYDRHLGNGPRADVVYECKPDATAKEIEDG